MVIIDKPLKENCYFHEADPKDGIMLHFTVGTSAASAWYTFQAAPANLGYPEGVPYIVDTNGDVWKCFDEKLYSYHIGVSGAFAQNHKHDKRLVGIEIANIGPLSLGHDGKTLLWNGGRVVFGVIGDPRCPGYVKLPVPFRGYEYFAAFTSAQVASTVALCGDIQKRIGFPRIIPPVQRTIVVPQHAMMPERSFQEDCRFAYDEAFYDNRKGVMSHVNFRQWDKWDMAPGHSDAIWAGLIADGWTEQD